MRLLGPQPRLLGRLVPWILSLIVLIGFGAMAFWARQQDLARRAAETRADAAEAQLVSAQASLTAVTRSVAAATATAAAEANQPQLALRRALDLVFAAYKDPSDGRLQSLSAAFSPDALTFERTEAEHLISGGLHLGGATPYDLQVVSTTPHSPDQAEIATHEVWTYDEYDRQNHKTRCVREESDQTYTMERVSSGWMVQDVQLSGTPRRTDC